MVGSQPVTSRRSRSGSTPRLNIKKLGVWPSVESKIAMMVNVRAALACAARGDVTLSIVYAADAKIEPGVKVVGVFPANPDDPIVYPVGATVNAKPGTTQYLNA
jgi:molybdate transport system substrate-binding protein